MTPIDRLRAVFEATASELAPDADALARILARIPADIERAASERLTIFPVAHHSPASGIHMLRWLHQHRPKVVFIELCEDLDAHIADLSDCQLPVALQAFASEPDGLPEHMAPLSIVAPLTAFSAESQAMAWARDNNVPVVFVDRSTDHYFQWRAARQQEEDDTFDLHDDSDEEAARMHGGADGVAVGALPPGFGPFVEALLRHAKMSHYTEWWDLYIEEPLLSADTETYRQVYFLIGSLYRHLDPRKERIRDHEQRERFMWTRMKQWLATHNLPPEDAVYICGAAHTASDIPEFGTTTDAVWDIPPRTPTRWQHGLIPTSYAAIERQFGQTRGSTTLAEARWHKALSARGLKAHALGRSRARGRTRKRPKDPPSMADLNQVLTVSPQLHATDELELVGWCTGIVALARKNRYLASTADAIAIFQTSQLLARMRSRKRPTAWDFFDAAETCLEKTAVPGKRSIRQLCGRLLGGDRTGQVGYDSLPPLVQDVYDRLAPLGITPKTRTVKRVLMDFGKTPHLRAASLLLWRLRVLTPGTRVARPIMGELRLGHVAAQESWDVRLSGADQRAVIQLSFEGVTVEQVLERRLTERAFAEDARTVDVLEAVEQSAVLLRSPRLTETLVDRAVSRLVSEAGVEDAPEIFDRIRRLVHHYRAGPDGLPAWLTAFVATGYRHYTGRLPEAFADRGVRPQAVGGMLSFVFTLESLALAMGCSRSQLRIAVGHSVPVGAEKTGLLWAVEWLLQERSDAQLTGDFHHLLDNPLSRDAMPRYLSGLLLAMTLSPRVAGVAADLLGRALHDLPDRVLMGWMPSLLTALAPHRGAALTPLFQAVMRGLPRSLTQVDAWEPAWLSAPEPEAAAVEAPVRSEAAAVVHGLLAQHPAGLRGHARALGHPLDAPEEVGESPAAPSSTLPILRAAPASLDAHARSLGLAHGWSTDDDTPSLGLVDRFPEALRAHHRSLR